MKMPHKDDKIRVDIIFKENLMKAYPTCRSMRERTKKLNELLEKILYGRKIQL